MAEEKQDGLKNETPLDEKEIAKEESFFDTYFSQEAVIRSMPFLLFLAAIAMFYISNRHFAERNVREIDKVNKELKELRSEYMTTKAELMYKSNQTEVAKRLEATGIKEAKIPPKKIVIKD